MHDEGMRGGPVISTARTSTALALAVALVGLPLACAGEGEPDADPGDVSNVSPEASSSSSLDSGASDAEPDDAGTCSTSGICKHIVPVETFVHLTSVWGSSATDVWAVGAHGTVLHYDGVSWERADTTVPEGGLVFTLRSVWLDRPDDVWIVDGTTQVAGGGILRHAAGWNGPSGTKWSFFTPSDGFGFEPRIVRGHGNTAWVAHGGSRLLEVFDGWTDLGPENATTVAPLRMSAVTALAVAGANEVWAAGSCYDATFVAQPGCVFHGSRSAEPPEADPTWTFTEHDSRTGKAFRGAWADESGVWLVGEAGTLRRMTRSAIPDGKLEIVTSPVVADLEDVFGFGPDDVWAVGEAATVLHWDGTAWKKLATPFEDGSDKPTLHAVWGSSPTDVWIAGDGTLLHFNGESSP